ncbi:MAG: NUDIX domain-containing protein [Proteobacteria bacterium]|nr:NUDIX domain-containing protein [Pseudomonadota bacterium]
MNKERPQCGLILENSEGKILLQLRDNKPGLPYPGCWGTFGGQIEEGETSEEAIRREIKEELNYELRNPEYFSNFPFDGYDIYMFRKRDAGITIQDLTVREGQKGEFLTLAEVIQSPCAFNCKEIVIAYFEMFHER